MEDPTLIALRSRLDAIIRSQDGRWTWLRLAGGKRPAVVFAPHWCDAFPAVGARPNFGEHVWLVAAIDVLKDRCDLLLSIYPTRDQNLRERVIKRLVEDPLFELDMIFKQGEKNEFTRLFTETIIEWPVGVPPQPDQFDASVRHRLDEAWKRWAGIPDALHPIFEEWRMWRS